MPEVELVETQQPRLAAERLGGVRQRMLEQRIRGRIARVGRVHRRGRDPDHAGLAVVALGPARQRVRRVRLALARRARVDVDVDAAALDPRGVDGNRVLLEARLAQPGLPVELPVVPGADHVVAVELALAERPADVVAHAGDRAERAVAMDQRDLGPPDGELSERRPRQLDGRADLLPTFLGHSALRYP